MKTTKHFAHAAVGGTFDHFHKGHEHILKTAFDSAYKVTIGLMADDLLDKKDFKDSIQSFSERKKKLEYFLKSHALEKRAVIIPLKDSFGPAIFDKSMDLIVVSKETKNNALKINQYRQKNGLQKLKIIYVTFVKATDRKIISSSRIRKGEINKLGQTYKSFFKSNSLLLPKSLRGQLRKPFGRIIRGNDKNIDLAIQRATEYIKDKKYPMIITVGDVVSQSFIQNNIIPSIQIIDQKTQRKEYIHTKNIKFKSFSRNMPGKIQKNPVNELDKKIKKFLSTKKNSILLIRGEEDLLALPAIVLAPLHSLVIYGQANIGIILVDITEETKEKVLHILSKFN